MFRRFTLMTVLLCLLPPVRSVLADSDSGRVEVEPKNACIGLFYSGQAIRVKVSAPDSEDIVMRLAGPEEPLVLKKKGKKYGFLWMNVGEVRYESVPTLYMLRSSRALDEIADPDTLRRLKLGFDALKGQVPAGSDDGAVELFGEMIKLKEQDRLFSCEASGVQLDPVASGRRQASGRFFLPAKTPVGQYTVDVFGFHDGEAHLLGTATVHLEHGPVVSSVASLAVNHGLLYGCLAVAVAVFAGLLTGFIFRR